jgi:glutamine synthetase
VICDLHLRSGAAVPFCTRQILRRHIAKCASEGLEFRVGLELEFYVARLVDDRLDWSVAGSGSSAPLVAPLDHGQLYLGESTSDRLDPVAELVRKTSEQLSLPLATVEVETGAGHLECTFDVLDAGSAADAALLFRAAVKQVGRRSGYHVSFMPRPQLAGIDPSGWHLHQSLWEGERNLFAEAEGSGLSSVGRHFLGGLLTHARDASLLYAPLVNSYKRFEPDSFAPWTACWTTEMRGSLVRALDGGDPAMTRLEFRGGDPSANPYLYVVSQLISGQDGMGRRLEPGPPEVEPGASRAAVLPRSLIEAVDAFERSTLLREQLGDLFVDYLTKIKRQELRRFLAAVTDWEQQEYFRNF